MHVLITGCCGFVGSELAVHLLEGADGIVSRITGVDNLSRSGCWRNRDRLIRKGIQVVHGDLRNWSDLEQFASIDWVIDAAANPSVLAGVDGKASSRQLVEHNLLSTVNLLELCKRCGAGFILLSTSRVYSIPPLANLDVVVDGRRFRPSGLSLPAGISAQGIDESFSTASPVSLYGATKVTSEQLAIEYGQVFDFPVWINRCGVMAGAGQFGKADQGIFSFWLHSWRESRPLKYIGFGGTGAQVRDCLHPNDLAELIMLQLSVANDGRSQVVNVSGGAASAMSLAELSDWCSNRWNQTTVTADVNPRPFDLPWVVLDHTLASDVWGWRPHISVSDILNEIACFADENPDWISCSA